MQGVTVKIISVLKKSVEYTAWVCFTISVASLLFYVFYAETRTALFVFMVGFCLYVIATCASVVLSPSGNQDIKN